MQKITLYGTNECCFTNEIDSILTNKEVEFTRVDIQNDKEKRREFMEKSEDLFYPVLEVGTTLYNGYDQEVLNKLTKQKKQRKSKKK